MSIDHGDKGYAPLPQSISNTDTEDEEEHLTQSNNIAYKIDNITIEVRQYTWYNYNHISVYVIYVTKMYMLEFYIYIYTYLFL